jgi:hypothetical protein
MVSGSLKGCGLLGDHRFALLLNPSQYLVMLFQLAFAILHPTLQEAYHFWVLKE